MANNRRRFLGLALGAGGCLALPTAWWWRKRSSPFDVFPASAGNEQVVTRTAWALGSDVSLTVVHADRRAAEQALDAAFAELERVEEVMSLYRPHSQLCRLNQAGYLDRPHQFLMQVLQAALELSSQTAGAFDVTVQPLWVLYAQAQKADRLPTAEQIEAARQLVDWRQVRIKTDRIEISPGMQITLNGIAQGFAADRAAAALRVHGVKHALVNTGEIGAVGGRTAREPWKVGIQHPRQADAYVSLARLEGKALATSGDYETSFSDDHRAHHIFDPRTGYSPPEFASVSVVAPSSQQADALSTALFVLGLERGMELVQSLPEAEALVVLKEGRVISTPGFPLEA